MRVLSCAIIAWFAVTAASATEVSGPVSGTWDLAGSPYEVVDQTWILLGQSLTIEPGVDVIFQGWYKLSIYGALQAYGTEADSILFTAVDTSQGWQGLRFIDNNTQSDSSRLQYCIIEYGRSAGTSGIVEDRQGGAIYCLNSSQLLISNCLLLSNRTGDVVGINGSSGNPGTPGRSAQSGHGGAIYIEESNPAILFNELSLNSTGNSTGGGGGNGSGSTGTSGADAGDGGAATSGFGGAIYCLNSAPYIHYNTFILNTTGEAIGGDGGNGANITSGGMFGTSGGAGGYGGEAYSGLGGAVYYSSCGISFSQNTFVSNRTGVAYGGEGGDGGNATVTSGNNSWGGSGGEGGIATAGGGGSVCFESTNYSSTIYRCIFHENSGGNATGGCGGDGGDAINGIPNGGNGGDGGDGIGGNGSCIYTSGTAYDLYNCTSLTNNQGIGSGGLGGVGGEGGPGGWSGSPGDPGAPGQAQNGVAVIYNSTTHSLLINSTILWGLNSAPEIYGISTIVNYSCIEGGWPGTGNIDANPLFVDIENDDFHLQSLEGSYHGGLWIPDLNHSPCIDSGDPSFPFNLEPAPNGGRINMGAYGCTIEASLAYSVGLAEEQTHLPVEFKLHPPHPNPFNPTTNITFDLPVASDVKLTVFDIHGRDITSAGRHKTDPYAEFYPPGTPSITFDGSNLSSGVYLYRLQAGEHHASGKMVLLK
ncbi:hypothetical protein KJ564_04355 [bacterium]|nr:hypothetical protein [bacterium]